MKVPFPGIYKVDQQENFRVCITCEGTAYAVFADVNGFALNVTQESPCFNITPALLAGPGSVNHVTIHCIYQGATPQARYGIRVLDSNGDQQDELGSSVDPTEKQPYRDDFDLRVEVA